MLLDDFMYLEKASERYLIKPGSRLSIDSVCANEKTLFDGKKEDSLPVMQEQLLQLKDLQTKLYSGNNKKLLVIMQAMDAGGKDGCVKSVFASVDPLGIHVEAFKRPSEEELAHDFLWRVHQKCPRNGMISVFNRSHYEDILAVRVKKLFDDEVWQRRYRHVNEFERMLAEEGTTIVKIFLRISKDEQAERLQGRLDNPEKHYKFEPGDLEDRKRWDQFMHAYEDLFEKTSTSFAPWYIVPADRKWYRNLVVSQILIDVMKGMDLRHPEVTWKPSDFTICD